MNLQRSISDLTGRAEDLEREAADLRRENGWLREIVMLKNSRLPPVDLVSHLSHSGRRSNAGPSASNRSGSREADGGSVSDSSHSDEDRRARTGKTKRRENGTVNG